jgi:putative thioredoxin
VSAEARSGAVFDVDQEEFEQRVLERSKEVPVVVDFWADWCAPCKQLTPVLERAAEARTGKVELAKVDVEKNPQLQAAFGIQGIPSVKAFRDGRVASEFTGALPPAEVERFFDALVPSQADELARSGDEHDLRRALELDPKHTTARRELGKLLLQRGERDEATELLQGAAGCSPARSWPPTRILRLPSRRGTRATAPPRSSCSRMRFRASGSPSART